MTERTRKILIFSALPIALVWAYFNMFGSRPISPSTPTPAASATVTALAAQSRTDTSAARIEQVRAEPWGADPFRMSSRPSEYIPEHPHASVTEPRTRLVWELNGILYSETAPFAYVNRRSVKVGDTINTATVVAIERKSVTLEAAGKRFKISLSKDAKS